MRGRAGTGRMIMVNPPTRQKAEISSPTIAPRGGVKAAKPSNYNLGYPSYPDCPNVSYLHEVARSGALRRMSHPPLWGAGLLNRDIFRSRATATSAPVARGERYQKSERCKTVAAWATSAPMAHGQPCWPNRAAATSKSQVRVVLLRRRGQRYTAATANAFAPVWQAPFLNFPPNKRYTVATAQAFALLGKAIARLDRRPGPPVSLSVE